MKLTPRFLLFLRFAFVMLTLSVANAGMAQDARFVIVIDAGHGGHDPGAVGDISREKDINLSISLELGNIIEQNFKDVKVVFTRKTDEYLTLQERADIVNNNHADLFICIHTNSTKGTSAFGAESFTLGLAKSKANLDVAMRENSVILLEDNYKTKYRGFDPASVDSYIMFEFMQDKYIDKSVEIASSIQKQFADYCHRSDRGVRQAGFWVLHRSACPSVLVEVGFISNPSEERYLNSSQGKHDMATAIFNAVVLYKRDHDRRSGKRPSAVTPKQTSATKQTTEAPQPLAADAKPNETTDNNTSKSPTPNQTTVPITPTPVKVEASNGNTGTKIVDTTKVKPSTSTTKVVNAKSDSKVSKSQQSQNTNNALSNVVKEVSESTKLVPRPIENASTKIDKPSNKTNLAYLPNGKEGATRPANQVSKSKTNVVVNKSRINEVRPDNDEQTTKNDTVKESVKEQTTIKQNDNRPVGNESDHQMPIFKVQIMASNKALKLTSSELKGQKGIEEFEESGWHKYTVGAEKDHAKIIKVKNSLTDKFPKAFVIAFYKGKKISEAEALKIRK